MYRNLLYFITILFVVFVSGCVNSSENQDSEKVSEGSAYVQTEPKHVEDYDTTSQFAEAKDTANVPTDSLCHPMFYGNPSSETFPSLLEEIRATTKEIDQNKYCVGIRIHRALPDSPSLKEFATISHKFCKKLAERIIKSNPSLANVRDLFFMPMLYKRVDFKGFEGAILITAFSECDFWWWEAWLVVVDDSMVRYKTLLAMFFPHEEEAFVISCIDRKKRLLTTYELSYSFIDVLPEFEDTVTAMYVKTVFRLLPDGFVKKKEKIKRIKLFEYDDFVKLVKRDAGVPEIDIIWNDVNIAQ